MQYATRLEVLSSGIMCHVIVPCTLSTYQGSGSGLFKTQPFVDYDIEACIACSVAKLTWRYAGDPAMV